MFSKYAVVAFLAGLAAAYHAPVGDPTGNAITAPLVEVVPAGKPYTIQWKADSPNTVSLILLKGGSLNAVFNQVIVEGIENTGSYTWTPPTTLEATDGPGGYGIQLIDDVDGHYQYSTQFGISNDTPVESSSSSAPAPTTTATAAATMSASEEGYAVSTSSSAVEVPTSSPVEESTSCVTTTTVYVPAPPPVGTGIPSGVPPTVIYPTGSVTVPESLKTSATGTGGYTIPTPSLPVSFEGSASGVKAGLGLAGAVAGLVFML